MTFTTFAALLLAVPAIAGAGEMPMETVSEQVQVDAAAGKVVATLTVRNGGQQPVYVPRALYQDDELIGPVFQVRHAATGTALAYTGRMVKRGPITADDYLAVAPGTTLTNRIDITPSYDFRAGEHTYQLSYPGSYLPDVANLAAPTPATVAPVTFSFRH